MFGWGEFRNDGKHREENRVENSVFHCLANERKQRGRKTREKIFSPGPTNFFLPNWEEKPEEKMLSRHFYHNALWNQVTKKLESTTVKHKIDGALNQNTNSNHKFKTNQIRTKKEKEKKKEEEQN